MEKLGKCSFFIKDKALFGCYPTQENVEELEKFGVKYYVNLTYENEKNIVRYRTKNKILFYPIRDGNVPRNWKTFSRFLLKISKTIDELKNNEKIYIHCRAGYSRSPLLVSCLLIYMYNYEPEKSITLTNKYFLQRVELKDKHRIVGFPQTNTQKNFILNFFKPLYLNDMTNIDDIFNKNKYQDNKYIQPNIYINIINNININFNNKQIDDTYIYKNIYSIIDDILYNRVNTENIDDNMLYNIKHIQHKIVNTELDDIQIYIKNKFIKVIYLHLYLYIYNNRYYRENLLYTGLRPIIFKNDTNNIIGYILMLLRNHFSTFRINYYK